MPDQALGEGHSHGLQRLGMHERYAVRLLDRDHRPRRGRPLRRRGRHGEDREQASGRVHSPLFSAPK